MRYSIKPILHHHKDKENNQKVLIQVIYSRMKTYAPTIVAVNESQFNGKEVTDHKQKASYNTAIKSTCSGIESRLLNYLKFDSNITKEKLDEIVKDKRVHIITNTDKVHEFIVDVADNLKGKVTDGRIKHYKVVAAKIKTYSPKATLSDINLDWVEGFEKYIRNGDKENKLEPISHNTIVSNMSILIRMIHIAMSKDLILTNPIRNYKRPNPEDSIPVYLKEKEIAVFQDMVDKIQAPRMKLAGYYYLLSCYTGWRISDAKTFSMDRFSDGKLVLRAKKNKTIVAISVFPRLQKVIDYIKDKPLDIPEQEVREHVKMIAGLCGIKKHLKFHSSRHSFAMLLRANGFTIDEIAEFLGDSRDVARIYARIENTDLNNKLMKALS